MQSWANYITRFRQNMQLTQREAARLLGVSQATLSRWEAGKQLPSLAERRRIQARIETTTGQARRLLEAVVRRSPLPVMVVDDSLRVLAASRPLLQLVGLPVEPAAEQQLVELLFGQDRLLLERSLARADVGLEHIALDLVTEVTTAAGRRLLLRAFWVQFVCGQGEVVYRVEIARLDPAEYEARLRTSGRFVVLRRADLLGENAAEFLHQD